jgi:hypothetical protein
MDQVRIDQIGTKEKLEQEVARYYNFADKVLGHQGVKDIQIPKINVRDYAKYVLRQGSREEKREIFTHLRTRLFIHDRRVVLKEGAE